MAGFAAYGFNKSHSTAYAFITYQTAYLKAHYPLDYMAALLTSKMGGAKIDTLVKYMRDVKRQGINIVQPSVNVSDSGFAVRFFDDKKEKGEIVFGLGGIKGVGEAAIDQMVIERDKNGEFLSVFDFVERLSKKVINKGTLDTLIKAGALDEFEMSRVRLLAGVENLVELAGSKRKNKKQKSFDFSASSEIDEDDELANERFFPKVPEWTKLQKLASEREVVGMYISDNPLNEFEDTLDKFCSHQMINLDEIEDGSKVVFGGIINDFALRTIQKGKSQGKNMATFGLDGLVGRVQCVCFSEAYDALTNILVPDKPLMIIGRINERNEEKQVVVDNAFPIQESKSRLTSAVYLRIRHEQARINSQLGSDIEKIFSRYRGKAEVYFEVCVPEGTVTLAANSIHKINPTQDFEHDIQSVLGENSINYRIIF